MSSIRLSATSVGLLALTTGLALPACDVPRPENAFRPTPRVVEMGDPSAFADGGDVPGTGAAGNQNPPDIGFPDVEGDAGPPVSVDSPLGKVQGFYQVRTDIEFTYSQTEQGQTLEVFNRISHFALTQLQASGDVLNAVERTCHIFYQHECRQNCDNFTTTIAPNAVPLYRQDLRRVYTLTAGNSQFVTDSTDLLLGWNGPANKLPTSLSDPSVWDADDNPSTKGLYVYVHTDGLPRNPFSPSSPTTLDCYYNMVERFTSAYSGSLNKAGSLDGVKGVLNTTGSDAPLPLGTAGGGLCAPSDSKPQNPVQTVRFARVEPADKTAFWTCPDKDTFRAKLPDP